MSARANHRSALLNLKLTGDRMPWMVYTVITPEMVPLASNKMNDILRLVNQAAVFRIVEVIFEGLPSDGAAVFVAAFSNAIESDGKNLRLVVWQFLAAELRSLPPVEPGMQAIIDTVIDGMDLLAQGKEWPEEAAAAAAAAAAVDRGSRADKAACWAARAAASAAGWAAKAARAATDWAESADRAAWAACWAARACWAASDVYRASSVDEAVRASKQALAADIAASAGGPASAAGWGAGAHWALRDAADAADGDTQPRTARRRQRDLLLSLIKAAPITQSPQADIIRRALESIPDEYNS
jgi:hypothetical protein